MIMRKLPRVAKQSCPRCDVPDVAPRRIEGDVTTVLFVCYMTECGHKWSAAMPSKQKMASEPDVATAEPEVSVTLQTEDGEE